MGGKLDFRKQQPKENFHNPEIHRQAFSVQSEEIRHSLLYAAFETGTKYLTKNGKTKGYWYE